MAKGSDSSSSSLKVQVLTVKPLEPVVVRFWGQIEGLILHWHNRRTAPCDGPGACPPTLHKTKSLWKGYAPGDYWSPDAKLWIPAVLEVSESLEEQLRGIVLRGHSYLLSRDASKGNNGQVGAVYVEEWESIPLPFDVRPVLCRLWHVDQVRLGVPNPLPAQVRLEAQKERGPRMPDVLSAAPQVIDQEAAKNFREQIEAQKRSAVR